MLGILRGCVGVLEEVSEAAIHSDVCSLTPALIHLLTHALTQTQSVHLSCAGLEAGETQQAPFRP